MLGCVLTMLAMAALTPAFVAAQAANTEYDVNALPGGKGGAGGSGQASEGSDGGGIPIALIAVVGGAAVCTGVAVWRLRDRPGSGGSPHAGPGAPEAASETQ